MSETKKHEIYEVCDAYLDDPYSILQDIEVNSDKEPMAKEVAESNCDSFNRQRDTEKEFYKVVKITIEEVTTLEDAEEDRVTRER